MAEPPKAARIAPEWRLSRDLVSAADIRTCPPQGIDSSQNVVAAHDEALSIGTR
jgi:hypothetical protein